MIKKRSNAPLDLEVKFRRVGEHDPRRLQRVTAILLDVLDNEQPLIDLATVPTEGAGR